MNFFKLVTNQAFSIQAITKIIKLTELLNRTTFVCIKNNYTAQNILQRIAVLYDTKKDMPKCVDTE